VDGHQRRAVDHNRDHGGHRSRCDDARNQISDRAEPKHDSKHMNQAIGPKLGAIEVEAALCRSVQFRPFPSRANVACTRHGPAWIASAPAKDMTIAKEKARQAISGEFSEFSGACGAKA
jgi:hypothetical protein